MSFAIAAVSMMAVGGAQSAVGAYYGAKGQKSALRYDAKIAEVNAKLAEQSAQGELLQGERDVAASQLNAAQLKSKQRTAYAANGIDLNSASVQEVQQSSEYLAEADAITISANAMRSAAGYRTQGAGYRSQAKISRATADGISPGMAVTSSLLSTGGQVASSWYTMNKAGAV